MDIFPFKIVVYPSIVSYAPTGDIDLLSISSSFNPIEIKRILKELLEKAMEPVPADSISRFLELGQFDDYENINFKIVLLPKKKDVPFEYMRNAMNNLKVATFGSVSHERRKQALKHLKLDPDMNLVFAYKSINSTGKQNQELKGYNANKADMDKIVNLIIRHSLIDIYKNNYYHYCVDYEMQKRSDDDESESEGPQTICVLALTDGSPGEKDKLKNFERYILNRFEKKYSKIATEEENKSIIQYGTLNLNWHPELLEFLNKTQTTYKLDATVLNYLIIAPDSDTFMIISPTNCILVINYRTGT